MKDLLTCPFCGWEPEIQRDHRWPDWAGGKGVDAYEVICVNFDCPIYKADNTYYTTEKEAIEAWNERHAYHPADGLFVLPVPREPVIAEYQTPMVEEEYGASFSIVRKVQEDAIRRWAREIDDMVLDALCEAHMRDKEQDDD